MIEMPRFNLAAIDIGIECALSRALKHQLFFKNTLTCLLATNLNLECCAFDFWLIKTYAEMSGTSAIGKREARSEVGISYRATATYMKVYLAIDSAIVSPVELALVWEIQISITVVGLYYYAVLFAIIHQFCNIYLKRCVALANMATGILTVHIHYGVMINSLELQSQLLTFHRCRYLQFLFIPSLTCIIFQPLHNIIGMGHRYIVVLTIYREVPLAAERYVLLGSSMQCKTRNDCKKQSSHMRIVLN